MKREENPILIATCKSVGKITVTKGNEARLQKNLYKGELEAKVISGVVVEEE